MCFIKKKLIFSFPRFYHWGRGGVRYRWSFGWLTGIDKDLVCVCPDVYTRTSEQYALSPVCSHPVLALVTMLFKAIVLKFDHNLRD